MGFDFVMSRDLVHDAFKRGMHLSTFLETLDPSDQYPTHERHQDAFQRQLARYDIRTQGDPVNGLVADRWERFFETDELGTREERSALAAEWLSRQYRQYSRVTARQGQIAGGWSDTRKAFEDGGIRFPVDIPVSYTLYPPNVLNELRYQMIQPSALNYLISRIRTIDSQTFKALYLTSDSTAQTAARMRRVDEFGEVPVVRFDTGENSIDVKKYGRRMQWSYEQMRRMSLDLVSWSIAYIAAMADRDKEDTALDVIVNGDGNSSTSATNTNGSTLDGAAGGALTLKMLLGWYYLWARPYACNVIVAQNAGIIAALLLNAGSANFAAATFMADGTQPAAPMIRPVRTTLTGVAAVDNSTAPANKLVGIDSNWALEMVVEAGADIVETDRIIQAQYTDIVLTESIGFAMATKGQNRTLAYTA